MRLLIVEDNDDHFFLISQLLRESNRDEVNIVRAGSLGEARAVSVQGPFDAVLLDLYLPDSRPNDTLAAALDLYEAEPVVVLTTLNDEEQGAYAIEHGAQDYVPKDDVIGDGKPFPIWRIIRYAIERKKYQDNLVSLKNAVTQSNERLRRVLGDIGVSIKHALEGIERYTALIAEYYSGSCTLEARASFQFALASRRSIEQLYEALTNLGEIESEARVLKVIDPKIPLPVNNQAENLKKLCN